MNMKEYNHCRKTCGLFSPNTYLGDFFVLCYFGKVICFLHQPPLNLPLV